MITVMIMTALLGIGFPTFVKGVGVDNWGHAGGAIIGALLAFAHHRMVRNVGRPRACELGLLSLALIVGCGLAQAASERRESRGRTEEAVRIRMQTTQQTFQVLRSMKLLIATPRNASAIRDILNRLEEELGGPETVGAYLRMRELAEKGTKSPLSADEVAEFQAAANQAEQTVRGEYERALNEFWSILKSRPTGPAGRR
jgi:hypothetical protein